FRKQLSDQGEEGKRAVRFRQIGRRASVGRPLLVAAQGKRGDGDDRRAGGGRRGAEPSRGPESRDLGQPDGPEDEIWTLLERDRHARLAVQRLDQAIGGVAQEVTDDLPVQLVVLNVQDRLDAHDVRPPVRRSGIAMKKVDPFPGSLSTQIRPRCISTNFLVMLRPSPVPPNSLATVASPCRNSVNRESILSFAIPIPVSATQYTRLSPWCSTE